MGSLKGKQFTTVYADANVTWEVKDYTGKGIYLCEIVDPAEYAGKVDVFFDSTIEAHLASDQVWTLLKKANESFYNGLKVGDVAHYNNGFGQFVRCKVSSTGKLRPIALVGKWRDDETQLFRHPNGDIDKPYWVRMIDNAEEFDPHSSNLWEASDDVQRAWMTRSLPGFDPTKEEPIKVRPVKPTREEMYIAYIHGRIGRAIERLSEVYDQTTDEDVLVHAVADAILELVGPTTPEEI